MFSKVIIFILSLFIFVLPSKSAELYSLNIPDEIRIELNNKNYNKYMRNIMQASVDGSNIKLENILPKYKKWIKAEVVINSQDNKKVKAEIRIMGDLKDHLRLPKSSLKVKLVDDNFYGVRRFRLLLPHTRNGVNEVFWTLVHKYIGFPVLHTKIIKVDINGEKYKAIFQEDSSKEFLERNSFRETVILKTSDYEFQLNPKQQRNISDSIDIYENFFFKSLLIDNNSFLDNDIALEITSEAIAFYSMQDFKNRVFKNDLFEKINTKYAPHGLTLLNEKYIFIPYKKMFIPLYYDGMVEIPPTKANCKLKVNDKIIKDFSVEYKKLSKEDLTYAQKCVFQEVFLLNKNYIEKDIKFKNFNFSEKLSYEPKYNKIKQKIIEFLNNNDLINKIDLRGMVYSFLENEDYYLCKIDIETENVEECQSLSANEYRNFMIREGNYTEFKNYRLFPINLGSFNVPRKIIEFFDEEKSLEQTFVLDNPYLYFININSQISKDYNFVFNNHEAKLIVEGSSSSNSKFNFFGDVDVPVKQEVIRFDTNLLTGCVTFLNVEFDGGSIFSNKMKCEDAINIISSRGQIDRIEISDSSYDGLDIDSSDISIKKMIVNKSGNDCADFSFGNYTIFESFMNNCQDKAFSFGERSQGLVKNSEIQNSLYGIVSKDNSVVKVQDTKATKITKFCLAAYNKKPEFEGAKIIKSNFVCLNESLEDVHKEYQDLKSIIQ